MHTAGVVILVVFLTLIAAGVGWIIYTRTRATRLGLPPPPLSSYIPFLKSSSSYSGPQPAPSGIKGWFVDLSRKLQQKRNPNTRTAAGAYEGNSYESSYNGGYGARRSPLDDEHAWDARVGEGYNPYEEERELGLHPPPQSSASPGYYLSQAQPGYQQGQGQVPQGDAYAMNIPLGENENVDERRGRTRSRSPGPNTGGAGGLKVKPNPFDDDAEPSNISLRGVSPRPVVDTNVGGGGGKKPQEENSPTERKSVFKENV